jgi:hypothetical protein
MFEQGHSKQRGIVAGLFPEPPQAPSPPKKQETVGVDGDVGYVILCASCPGDPGKPKSTRASPKPRDVGTLFSHRARGGPDVWELCPRTALWRPEARVPSWKLCGE